MKMISHEDMFHQMCDNVPGFCVFAWLLVNILVVIFICLKSKSRSLHANWKSNKWFSLSILWLSIKCLPENIVILLLSIIRFINIINPVLQSKHSFDSFVFHVNRNSIAPKPICIFYFLIPKNLPFKIKIDETLDKLFLEPLEWAKRNGIANRQKLVFIGITTKTNMLSPMLWKVSIHSA